MRWIATWMLVISGLHIGVAILLHGSYYQAFFANGLWATATSPSEDLAVWFFVAGVLMFLLGYLFLQLDLIPRVVGVVLGLLGLIGGALIPVSGFWFLVPPAIGILIAKRNT